MPAPLTQQIVFLYVRDLEASAAFYTGVLGLALARDQGACHIYRAAPNAFIGLCQRPEIPLQTEA